MSRFTLTTAGMVKMQENISRVYNTLSTEGMRRHAVTAGEEIVKQYKQNIMEFTPGSVPDLKEATKKYKTKKYGRVYPILIASGEMFASIASRVRLDSRGWVIQIYFKGAQNMTKALAHIKGTEHLPARDFTTAPRSWFPNFVSQIRNALRSR